MIDFLQTVHQSLLTKRINGRIATASSGTWAHVRELERSQWLPRSEIAKLQLDKLRALLRHANANCRFYAQRFSDARFDVEAFNSFKDLERIPPLTKQEIQDHHEDMIAANLPKADMLKNQTGGSTGQPITFFQSWDYREWALADLWRNYTMCGFQPGMRRAFLWGSDYDSKAHKSWMRRLLQDRLRENVFWIDTFDIDERRLLQAAQRLERFRPHVIVGYVSSLCLFADVVKFHGISGIRPIAIQSSAEVLSAVQRELLEKTFHTKVFDRYGCREVGNIAHECDHHSGLHLLAECNYTEFLVDGHPVKPGEVGLVTVTNLFNRAMPLIRYQLDDLAIPSQVSCTCGRGLPLMHSVEGRRTDVILSPSGKLLHGEFFTHLFYKLDGVRQFQVVQESQRELVIFIEPRSSFHYGQASEFLTNVIRQHGDPDFEIEVKVVNKIPPSSSGKFRFTVSKLSATSHLHAH
jgi:phenylacetate-CoA ligase